MKAAWSSAVVVLWIYSVFQWAHWRMVARAQGERPARANDALWINVDLNLSGLPVLAWLILMMG